jgi:MarR family transcriptional regulator, organic hydroperoxide resistance regulator
MTAADTPRLAQVAGICTAFTELFRTLHTLERPAWIDVDLTMGQLRAVVLVAETGGLSGRSLGERLGITPSAVTALVDRLVQRGYVRREEDATDRRVSWARPTDQALELFARIHASHRRQLEGTLALISAEELEVVERALVLLRDAAVRRLTAQAAPAP